MNHFLVVYSPSGFWQNERVRGAVLNPNLLTFVARRL